MNNYYTSNRGHNCLHLYITDWFCNCFKAVGARGGLDRERGSSFPHGGSLDSSFFLKNSFDQQNITNPTQTIHIFF